MTPQATNRREGGLSSCCGHGRKFRDFTQKELESVRAAQKLLGVPNIGGGECPSRRWRWREFKESNKPPPAKKIQNSAKNGQFPALIDLKIAENTVFYSEILKKIYFKDVF
jgi:hypothetical protein